MPLLYSRATQPRSFTLRRSWRSVSTAPIGVFLELKRQVQAGESRDVIGRTVEKIEGLLGETGANLMYAGYPSDPYA